jgi:hypothetical protein
MDDAQSAPAFFALLLGQTFRGGYGSHANDVRRTRQMHSLAVPGALRFWLQTPVVMFHQFMPAWIVTADDNTYGEDGPPGPATPRNLHGNIYTLGMHYQF